MAEKSIVNLGCMLRLWGIVFAANMVGAFLFAAFCGVDGLLSPEVRTAFDDIAHHLVALDPVDKFWRGIFAGWLIAVMVWVLPNCRSGGGEIVAIILLTYLIALGDFTHIIAGSVEALWLTPHDGLAVTDMLVGFVLPTFLGNVVGGSLLFAMISYAQVQDEI